MPVFGSNRDFSFLFCCVFFPELYTRGIEICQLARLKSICKQYNELSNAGPGTYHERCPGKMPGHFAKIAEHTVDGRTNSLPGGFLAITRHQEVGEVPG